MDTICDHTLATCGCVASDVDTDTSFTTYCPSKHTYYRNYRIPSSHKRPAGASTSSSSSISSTSNNSHKRHQLIAQKPNIVINLMSSTPNDASDHLTYATIINHRHAVSTTHDNLVVPTLCRNMSSTLLSAEVSSVSSIDSDDSDCHLHKDQLLLLGDKEVDQHFPDEFCNNSNCIFCN